MQKISDTLSQVKTRIQHAAAKAKRNSDEITLLAVSKRQPASKIEEAFQCGHHHFGENYLQEAIEKIDTLKSLDITWHFIGSIQSNKTRSIAESFSWVHTIDRLKIAQRLSQQRPPELAPLNVCIQINIDGEDSKSGILPEELVDIAENIAELPNIKLRGLMIIPQKKDDDSINSAFRRTRLLFEQLKKRNSLAHIDTLSMGMSSDIEEAINEGANIVRVGTAIFGKRDP